MLQFQNVIFRHEQSSQTLLGDVTRQCPPGWMGVVGPNGAGKTTLLLLACGKSSPTQGQVRSDRDLVADGTDRGVSGHDHSDHPLRGHGQGTLKPGEASCAAGMVLLVVTAPLFSRLLLVQLGRMDPQLLTVLRGL